MKGMGWLRKDSTRRIVILLAALVLAGFEPYRLAWFLAWAGALALLVLSRTLLVGRCGYCGGYACGHEHDPVKGHPLLGALRPRLDRTPDIERALGGEGRGALVSVVQKGAEGEEYRRRFLQLAASYPGAALAIVEKYPARARAALVASDLSVLLARANRDERVRVLALVGALSGGAQPL